MTRLALILAVVLTAAPALAQERLTVAECGPEAAAAPSAP